MYFFVIFLCRGIEKDYENSHYLHLLQDHIESSHPFPVPDINNQKEGRERGLGEIGFDPIGPKLVR